MAKITYTIPVHNYHLIRNRIGEIIADEIMSQVNNYYNPELESSVWLERTIPFTKEELEEIAAINVQLATGAFSNKHQGYALGTYQYFIDVIVNSKSEENPEEEPVEGSVKVENNGDELAAMKLGIVMGAVRYILEDSQYTTLGFQRGFIGGTMVTDMVVADEDTKARLGYISDARHTHVGRILFQVKAGESGKLVEPKTLESHITQVYLGITDKGYQYEWGLEGDPIAPDPRYVKIIDQNNNVLALVPGGSVYQVEVLKQFIQTLGEPPGGQIIQEIS